MTRQSQSTDPSLILFPNQLYAINYLPKPSNISTVYLVEDPIFFGVREKIYHFNQVKLLYHRASMCYYYDYLQQNKYHVIYITCSDILENAYDNLPLDQPCSMFTFYDHLLHRRLRAYMKKQSYIWESIEWMESPNFIVTETDLHAYHSKQNDEKKQFQHQPFYQYVKEIIGLLENEPSHDSENRKSLPSSIKIPPLPDVKEGAKYVTEAKKYIQTNFPNHPGSVEHLQFPITHDESIQWVDSFLTERFHSFGDYQDSISKKHPFLFHSTISPMLNIGLLQPCEVVSRVKRYYQTHKNEIGMNDYEGFIRQLIGWREYQRYVYMYAYDDIISKNYFNHTNGLTSHWYDGSTGIQPVDDCIHTGFKYGYLHHINRLMVMSNIMNLCRISPHECYRWFMEFAIDSYDWVMIQNVYSMGQWSDGGLTMRKPYLSSNNYIANMGDYGKADKSWGGIWRGLYYCFLVDHKKQLSSTPYLRNLSHWNKMTTEERNQLRQKAKSFITSRTKTNIISS